MKIENDRRSGMIAAAKRRVLSNPWRIVCSECRYGWNGAGTCWSAGTLAERRCYGCPHGQLIPELKYLYQKQCLAENWSLQEINLFLRRMGCIPPGFEY